MQLKTIDPNQPSFTANGKEYFIEKGLSIQRAVYAEAQQIQMEAGLRMGKQLDDWKQVYELANKQKFADIVVLAYNNMRGFRNFFEEQHPVLKYCACFVNTEDEDRRGIDDDLVDKKIKDWAEEGIAMEGFFALALTFIKSGVQGYQSATESILDTVSAFQEKVKGKAGTLTPISTPTSV
ncbi:MAG: hypothetical protein QM610_06200 [Chitinophagaceae bacterium]